MISHITELETYELLLNPLNFATVTGEHEQPRTRNCTVCTETYKPESASEVRM
jgi:hypothetical protein